MESNKQLKPKKSKLNTKSASKKIKSCAYFGIYNCTCCNEKTINLTKNNLSNTDVNINNTASTGTGNVTEKEDEEIDVVNLSPEEINNSLLIVTGTTENQPKQKSENHLRFQDVNQELENAEDEEIDVVNLPVFEENLPSSSVSTNISETPPRKQRKIDMSNNSNYRLRTRNQNRRNSELTSNDSIIEIIDSPNSPRIITEIIDIDGEDDENFPSCSPNKNGGPGNCPVCLESLTKKEIMSTLCGHVFCSLCITKVIKTTKKCPKCRKHLTLKSIHPLFF